MTETTTATPDGGATSTTADAAGDAAPSVADRLAFLESEAKKAFEMRDALKAEVREYKTREKEMAEAEAQRAAKAGEYQQAYEALAKEHADLKTRMADYDATQSFLASSVESAMEALPEDIRNTVPETLPAVDRLRLAQSLAKHLTKTATSPPVPTTPAPTNGSSGPPPRNTPEFAAWQNQAPIEEVRAARKSWFSGK